MSDDRLVQTCPNCAARVRVPATAAGRRVRCPKCQTPFVVSAPQEPESTAASNDGFGDDLFAGLASGAAVESTEERQARQEQVTSARARAQVVTSTPAVMRAPRASFDIAAWLANFGGALKPKGVVGRLSFAGLMLGGLFVYLGIKEHQLRGRSRAEPQTISCQQLIKNGPGDNLHMVLTDFVLMPEYVYETAVGKWSGAWAPALPRGVLEERVAAALHVAPSELATVSPEDRDTALAKLNPADFNFKIIVSFPKADGEEYMESMLEAETLQGTLFTTGLNSLSRSDRDRRSLLHESYPRTDLDACWVLVVGRAPRSAATANAYVFGGAGLALTILLSAAWRASRATT